MFKESIINLLVKETQLPESEVSRLLEVPPDQKLGDYAFPCFTLASKLKKSPVIIAQELAKKIKSTQDITSINAVGPYLNFTVNKSALAASILPEIQKRKQSYGTQNQKANIVIEYCGPNTNKPLHLGHLRNMSLGNAMCRILEFSGNKIHPVNIINDRGIHICQSMLAYMKWGKKAVPSEKGDHYVGDFYVMYAQKAKVDESLEKQAQELLLKFEQKDKAVTSLLKKMNSWVLKGFNETYKRFGIEFEKEYFESIHYEKGKDVAKAGLKNKIFTKNDKGAIIAPLGKYELSDKVVLRADGTSVYITQDMYLAEERFKDFKFDKMIYVVASEQELHFKQLFAILKMLGQTWANRLHHLSYGLVNLPTGRMKSREGTVVDADDIMDEVVALAKSEVDKRYEKLSEKEKSKRAELIGLGALKFFLLKTDASRDMIFNPEESIQFEGETGPYLQYAHARACSILRKAKMQKSVSFNLLREPIEQQLVKSLADFPKVIEQTSTQYKPHIICHYLLNLAQSFNEFYHSQQVISDNKDVMNARLYLVDCVRQVLANGLTVLGIVAPEEM